MPERTIWREATVLREYERLTHDPVFTGDGVEDGDDQPVLLIPGFLTADNSLSTMGAWLKRTGHHPFRTHNGVNIACGEWAVTRLERRLQHIADRTGRRVAIIGHSRGGHFARVLAVRRPDLVSGIVTMGAPPLDPSAVHPLVALPAIGVALVGGVASPRFFGPSCFLGKCCRTYRVHLHGPFPSDVGFVSVYSKRDGIVDWRKRVDTAGRPVEIDATHLGFAVNAQAYRAVADALASFRAT